DITTSPKLSQTSIGKVIVSIREMPGDKQGRAAEFQVKSPAERLVRKALLKRGIDLIVGEVRAKVESNKDLQTRKEGLSEAEKLILLGKDTGADAILVFDEATPASNVYDVKMAVN